MILRNNGYNETVTLEKLNYKDTELMDDSIFYVEEGLIGDKKTLSFRSFSQPKGYLIHRGYLIRLKEKEWDEYEFFLDASWYVEQGRADSNGVSMRSKNYPNYNIGLSSGEIKIVERGGSISNLNTTTWYSKPLLGKESSHINVAYNSTHM